MTTIIVTRHRGLVEYIRETMPGLGPAEVITHISDPERLKGTHVIGVLPLHLASRASQITEIPLALTPEDRAAGDLPLERVRQIAGRSRTYIVQEIYPTAAMWRGEYGPCHLCGAETPDRHGEILLGCDCSGPGAVEVCAECMAADPMPPCPDMR